MKADTEIQSVEQYKRKLERYQEVYPNGLYFRGEADDYPDHIPSIARDEDFLHNEAQVFRKLVSEHPDEGAGPVITTIAKIQHYRGVTRLIDLTIDPLVALYFACEHHDEKPGFVFLYIPNGTEKEIDSPEVRALSLYASEDLQSATELNSRYKEVYGKDIDVAACCSATFIMKYDERLFSNNDRMKLQKGAFAVCGADVSRLPERTIIPFDLIPTRVFMIPVGFKATIKKELADMGVQPKTIYPEVASTLERIKAELKQSREEVDLGSCYEVVENSGIRKKILLKDLVLKIKLIHPLDNNSVKEIVRLETRKYTNKADVVWSYVANSDTDIQITNWRLRGKWIRTGLEGHTPLREIDTDGFSWDVTSGSVIHSLWMQEHGFGEDRIELCKYIKAFKLLQPEINKAREYAEGIVEKPVLTWCSKALNIDVLYAHDRAMDRLFQSFQNFFTDAAALNMLVKKEDKPLLSLELKNNVLPDEKKIKDELPHWVQKFDVTEEEIEAADPFKREKTTGDFRQTIPMGKNPLAVKIDVTAKATSEGRAEITGFTNLFDGAILMVELDGRATGKPELKNGSFSCVLGAPESCHIGEQHLVTVILPVPSVQPLEFVKKAGMEYENLDGYFIKREGLGVSGRQDIEVILE